MNAGERADFEPWREARTPYRDGTSLMNAYLAGHRAGVEFEALTKTEAECPGCGNRVLVPTVGNRNHPAGVCPLCGAATDYREERDPTEEASYHRETRDAWEMTR